jgi:pyruvate/2-oxoglutarate dehydrogenase complex dihydrolipoamide acyltransferase (E2) component
MIRRALLVAGTLSALAAAEARADVVPPAQANACAILPLGSPCHGAGDAVGTCAEVETRWRAVGIIKGRGCVFPPAPPPSAAPPPASAAPPPASAAPPPAAAPASRCTAAVAGAGERTPFDALLLALLGVLAVRRRARLW